MTRYLGGLITKDESLVIPANNFQDTSAPGVWTLEEAQALNKQGLWPTAGLSNPAKFVENLFSCFTYTGNDSSSRAIDNGIDLSGEGGMVWFKSRSIAQNHRLFDTERGYQYSLIPNGTSANNDHGSTGLVSFNNNGFTLGNVVANASGASGGDYVSWTFRKAEKFFDIQTWTGDGTNNRAIAHNLNHTVGAILIKVTSGVTDNWIVYHRSLGYQKVLRLNLDGGASTQSRFGNQNATSSHFYVDNNDECNTNGYTYIAYLFGHDTSSDGMVQCGAFTTDSGSQATIDLGFEPQWVMYKKTNSSGQWYIEDTIRGLHAQTQVGNTLIANLSNAEGADNGAIHINASGFSTKAAPNNLGGSNDFVYMAIRKGLMATPTSRASVFDVQRAASPFTADFPTDLAIQKNVPSAGSWYAITRLAAPDKNLQFNYNADEGNIADQKFDNMTEWGGTSWGSQSIGYSFRRAPKFFDIVAYVGTGSAKTENHNLGVVPEMMWVKSRSDSEDWSVYYGDATDYLKLNNTDATADDVAYWNDTAPTSTVFTVGTQDDVNKNTKHYLAYLFATLAGISKVGTFSHTNGSSTDVDCGFSSGSSFVIVKRTDSTGDWYVWDSARGIVSGNDSYMVLNTDVLEVTNQDYIDPLSSGFQIASGFTTGSYMFYAIAA